MKDNRLKPISESLKPAKVNEAVVSDEQMARVDRLKEAYGVDEFIVNLCMKLDNDTLEDVLEMMERDMGIAEEEEEEQE